jgi:hypothetical protein
MPHPAEDWHAVKIDRSIDGMGGMNHHEEQIDADQRQAKRDQATINECSDTPRLRNDAVSNHLMA